LYALTNKLSERTAEQTANSETVVHTEEFLTVIMSALTLSNSIFLPTAYSPPFICFGQERGWWITCNYSTVLKENNTEKQEEYNLRHLLAKVRTT
jgi:hypothetical protein